MFSEANNCEKLRERGQFAEYLSCVGEAELSPEDRVDLGLSPAFASAIPGSVRFIDPRNPYRVIGNVATVAYPCFMGLNEDLETLEAEGLESREEIRKVYQNLVQPLRTPTGQDNPGGDKSLLLLHECGRIEAMDGTGQEQRNVQ